MAQSGVLTAGCWPFGLARPWRRNDESVTSRSYMRRFGDPLDQTMSSSAYWQNKSRFLGVRQRLESTARLLQGWDTYFADAPNDHARAMAWKIVAVLEQESLPPTRLMPSSEGGIAISFVEDDNRAELEIYNTGEIAVATYSSRSEPVVWELDPTDSALKNAIDQIRVHLAA